MKRWKVRAQRLAYELLVVFIGVYLAFLLSDMQQKRLEERKKVQILKGLQQELNLFVEGATYHLAETDSLITHFEALQQQGVMPIPFRYVYTGADRPPNSFWQATLSSGAIELLDVELLTQMALYYNSLESALRKYNALYEFGQKQILPFATDDRDVFYTDSTHLKPLYAEYIQDFKTYQKMGVHLKTRATSMITTLAHSIE